jgi:hypothetical protein
MLRGLCVELLAAVLLIAAAASAPLSAAGHELRAVTTFTPTPRDFPNPERGFWRVVAGSFAAASAAQLSAIRAAGLTLAYGVVRLDAFRAGPLPQTFLTRLAQAFAHARAAGIKVILRFAYNYPETAEEAEHAEDAPLAVVLGHIGQLAPLLAANADVIAVWQAGFIGAWGEAHSSSHHLDQPAPKRAIRDALLAALPADRLLQWRYPPDLIAWSPVPGPGGHFPRIGFHNDCFMASPTDVGTYAEDPVVRAQQRAYTAQLTRTTLFGGETCRIDEAPPRVSCAAILREGPQFHLTTLNRDYHLDFHRRWSAEGCFGAVKRRMGYRLELVSASVDEAAARGEEVTATVRLRNVGWARLANRRSLRLFFRHDATGRSYGRVRGDLRTVAPERPAPVAFVFKWKVPADAPTGRYEVTVAAPDPAPRLRARRLYAVRFANADDDAKGQRWDVARAEFDTGLSILVTP